MIRVVLTMVLLTVAPNALAQTEQPEDLPVLSGGVTSARQQPATAEPPPASGTEALPHAHTPALPTAAALEPGPQAAPPLSASVGPSGCIGSCSRGGFYFRLSTGIGYASLAGDGPDGSASLSGLGNRFSLTFGGDVAPGLVLAGTLQGSSLTSDFDGGPLTGAMLATDDGSVEASAKADAASAQLGVLVDWYPRPAGGWHAGVSAGLGVATVVTRADDEIMLGTSVAGSLFGGYDWSIARSWSVGVALVASGASSASMKDESGERDLGYDLRSVFFGVEGSLLYF